LVFCCLSPWERGGGGEREESEREESEQQQLASYCLLFASTETEKAVGIRRKHESPCARVETETAFAEE